MIPILLGSFDLEGPAGTLCKHAQQVDVDVLSLTNVRLDVF